MIFHWSDDTLDLEYGIKLSGLQQDGVRPFAITLTFEELKKLMQDPVYMHYMTYALSGSTPQNYKELIQR